MEGGGCDDNDDEPCDPIRLMVRIMMVGVEGVGWGEEGGGDNDDSPCE